MRKFPCLVLPRNAMILLHLISNFRSIVCPTVAYWRSKTEENFKLLALKKGRGRLREVSASSRSLVCILNNKGPLNIDALGEGSWPKRGDLKKNCVIGIGVGWGQCISFSHVEHTGQHFHRVHFRGSTNTKKKSRLWENDPDRVWPEICATKGTLSPLDSFWITLAFRWIRATKMRNNGIIFAVTFYIRTAVHVIVTGIILQYFVPLNRDMGIKYLAHSAQGICSDPSQVIIFLTL